MWLCCLTIARKLVHNLSTSFSKNQYTLKKVHLDNLISHLSAGSHCLTQLLLVKGFAYQIWYSTQSIIVDARPKGDHHGHCPCPTTHSLKTFKKDSPSQSTLAMYVHPPSTISVLQGHMAVWFKWQSENAKEL